MYLLMLAAAFLMQGADVHGRWELQNPAIGPKAGVSPILAAAGLVVQGSRHSPESHSRNQSSLLTFF